MKKLMYSGLWAIALGTALSAVTVPASAQLARPQTALGVTDGNDLLTEIQFRGRGGYGGYRGVAMVDIAAMVDTAAAIVMADGAGPASDWVSVLRQAQSSAAHLHRRTITIRTPTLRRLACTMAPLTIIAYCMQRFRSYDPASRTYVGYDGLRHPCP